MQFFWLAAKIFRIFAVHMNPPVAPSLHPTLIPDTTPLFIQVVKVSCYSRYFNIDQLMLQQETDAHFLFKLTTAPSHILYIP